MLVVVKCTWTKSTAGKSGEGRKIGLHFWKLRGKRRERRAARKSRRRRGFPASASGAALFGDKLNNTPSQNYAISPCRVSSLALSTFTTRRLCLLEVLVFGVEECRSVIIDVDRYKQMPKASSMLIVLCE
jgi:hypothetical protein